MLTSNSIGNKIAAARKKLRLSQAELARKISISPQAVGKWERGASMPDIHTLNRLAEIFGVDLNYFSDNDRVYEAAGMQPDQPIVDAGVPKERKRFGWNWDMSQGNWKDADFSGAEILEVNFEQNAVQEVVWKFTTFKKTNISNVVFEGSMEDCHFEHCSFYNVKFENATILNTFFKYNDRFKKVQFINCRVDSISYAFLKNNQANLEGITLYQD